MIGFLRVLRFVSSLSFADVMLKRVDLLSVWSLILSVHVERVQVAFDARNILPNWMQILCWSTRGLRGALGGDETVLNCVYP